jgi:vesicle-associated membrane protein 7
MCLIGKWQKKKSCLYRANRKNKDRYLFHYICEDGIIYMCMADDSFGRRIPFIFLQDLKEKFLNTYGKNRALEAPPYGLNEFSRVIEKQMV